MTNLPSRRRAFALLTTLILTACDTGNQGQSSQNHSPVTLRLGDQSKLLRAKAEAAGVLVDTSYKIEWVNFQGAAPLFEALAAGAVDTGIAADSPALFAVAAGTAMKLVAVAHAATLRDVAILVPANSPVKTVSDLKGRDVIVSTAKGSVSHYQLIGALKEAGLTSADIKLSFMLPVDALVAFNAGHISAWATFGPYLVLAEQQGARVVRDGEGISSGNAFFTVSGKALADPAKRAAVADVVARLARADEWALNHHDDYVRVFTEITGLPPAVGREVVSRELGVWKPIDEESIIALQKVADVFAKEHIFAHPLDVRDFIDASLIKK